MKEINLHTSVALPDTQTLASWTVLRLMQEIETYREKWSAAERIALYRAWLAAGIHNDAYAGHYNLGTLYHTDGQIDLAEAEYRAVLRLVELPEARYNLGLVMEQSGRLYEAIAEWRKLCPESSVVVLSPIGMAALSGLIRLSRRVGQVQELRHYLELSLAYQPNQPTLAYEMQQLVADNESHNQPQLASSEAVIYVIAVSFNEAAILPFFLDHYINFLGATKVILHDGGSTDGTAEIAARYPQVELVLKPSEKLDDRDLMDIRNEEWKKYRDQCDWIVVCDVDEFLYHPDIRSKLADFKRQGITLPMVEGFEMLSKEHPQYVPNHYIWENIQTGTPNPQYYNKNLIFDPKIEINYLLGCHSCAPTGPVKRTDQFEFKNLHFRMLSHRHIVEKSRRAAARLSDWNKQTSAGFHYRLNAEMQRDDYNKMFLPGGNVVQPRPRPIAQREAFEVVLQHLLALDDNAVIVEQGCACGFGHYADSGSTEFLAWYVHSFGGQMICLDADSLVLRHVTYALSQRGLLGEHVMLRSSLLADDLPNQIDLVMCNATDYRGDANDRVACEHAVLDAFVQLEQHLSEHAVVVLDGIEDEKFTGKFRLLADYLISHGFQLQRGGYTALFSKVPLKSNL